MKKAFQLLLLFAVLFCANQSFSSIVLDFEDISPGEILSGTNYAGLTWEFGNTGYLGNQGYWSTYDEGYPNSGDIFVLNALGCSHVGIQFPSSVNVLGVYIAKQGGTLCTTGVRVHGYLDGEETIRTEWFNDLDTHPDWFAINFSNVDRIVFESIPKIYGGGWFAMDDLTYEIPEPATLALLALGGLALRKRK